MAIDLRNLKTFYKSPLGLKVASIIHQQVSSLWPSLENLTLLGYGYALPYLQYYLETANHVLAFMPAHQGVLPWPKNRPSLTALIHEEQLPLPDQSIDRVIFIHGLEYTRHVRTCLRETWRILAPQGRIMIIAPNRRSLWAQLDHTPFGQGQPYTMTQMITLLRDNMFVPLRSQRALYFFPSSSRFVLTTSNLMEGLGQHCLQKFSGVICIEAMKQIYASTTIPPLQRLPPLFRPANISST